MAPDRAKGETPNIIRQWDDADGNRFLVFDDGHSAVIAPNGVVTEKWGDRTIVKYPDRTTVVRNEDGSTHRFNPDGSGRSTDRDGTVTEFGPRTDLDLDPDAIPDDYQVDAERLAALRRKSNQRPNAERFRDLGYRAGCTAPVIATIGAIIALVGGAVLIGANDDGTDGLSATTSKSASSSSPGASAPSVPNPERSIDGAYDVTSEILEARNTHSTKCTANSGVVNVSTSTTGDRVTFAFEDGRAATGTLSRSYDFAFAVPTNDNRLTSRVQGFFSVAESPVRLDFTELLSATFEEGEFRCKIHARGVRRSG